MSADLAPLRRQLDRADAIVDTERVRLAQAQALVVAQAQAVEAADVALHAVRSVRDLATARVQQRLTDLATEALRVVFDDPSLALVVRSVERRGVAEADIVLRRGGLETDPLDGNGGGMVADISAMLRLIMVRMLTRRGLAPLLLLDEPFAALSAGHREAMADTLEAVGESLGIQIVTVTHAPEMVRGVVYRAQWVDREAIEATLVREDN